MGLLIAYVWYGLVELLPVRDSFGLPPYVRLILALYTYAMLSVVINWIFEEK